MQNRQIRFDKSYLTVLLNMFARNTLRKNHLAIDNLFCSAADVVHALYPKQLILGFQILCDAFTECHFIYYPKKDSLCTFVHLMQISIQPPRCEQVEINVFITQNLL